MLRGSVSGAAVVALACVATLCAAGTAVAAPEPGTVSEDALPSPQFLSLHGTHGYEIGVDAYPGKHRRAAEVVVYAHRGRSTISYAASANLAGEGIHASLGRFGRIDLRWVPDGRVAEVRFACHGHGPIRRYFFDRGLYVGGLRFRGGDGFTAVRAHRVEWRRSWYRGDSTCRREGGESYPGPGAILNADTGGREPRSTFAAYQSKPDAPVYLAAFDREVIGHVTINRAIETRGPSRTLDFPRDLSSATVSPPAPFTGSATFAATEELEEAEGANGTWLGDLAVDFPDGSHISLAGDAFEANFRSGTLEGLSRP